MSQVDHLPSFRTIMKNMIGVETLLKQGFAVNELGMTGLNCISM